MTFRHSKDVLWLDFETFSEADLKKCGADVYSRHARTEPLMLGWAINDDEPQLWDIVGGDPVPFDLYPFLVLHAGTIRAHNAPFEIAILQNALGYTIDINQWQCSQVMAYSLSFAGGLGQILKAIGMPPDMEKDTHGKKLIQKFCKLHNHHNDPRKSKATDPQDWASFEEYCLQDVAVLRALWGWCDKYSPVSDNEWALWRQDREINQRGLPVDYPLVDACVSALSGAKEELQQRIGTLIGDQKITNGPLKNWLNTRDAQLANLQKATKEKALLRGDLQDGVRQVIEAHLLLAQASSSSKWAALYNRGDHDAAVIRETIQFVGAGRTGRAAGRGLQLQNLKRSPNNMDENIAHILTGEPASMEQISTSIRGAIKAPPGYKLVVSDLSSIESRVVGWLTGCTRIMDTFAGGRDTYKDLATEIFSVPYVAVTKAQRTFAKPAALGCQYMLGAKGLVAYADNYGIDLHEREAKQHVDTYRAIYPELPKFWAWIKEVIFYVIQYGKPVSGYRLKIYKEGEFLFIDLPGGRRLNYFHPEREMGPAPWDKHKLIPKFQFEGMSQFTQQWGKITAHPGGITENIVQAIARDILYVWMQRAEAAGHVIIGSVHDEIITKVEEWRAPGALANLNAQAALEIPWAKGLQLTADGYISERYRKD